MARTKRRDEILEAALDELGRRGLEGLSMAGLARRVGLVPSGLYRHFDSKEELLTDAIASIGDRLGSLAKEARSGPGGTLEVLERLLLAHVKLIRTRSGIPRVMFGEVVFGARGALRDRGQEVVEGYLGVVAELFRQGLERSEIRAPSDPRTLAILFLGLIQPLAILWELSDGGVDVTAQARRSWEVFAHGLRPVLDRGEY